MTNIVSSKQINNVELIYGGKANSLIRLVKMGMPVLDFFVVPADYFYRFVEYNNVVEEIETLLAEKKFSKAKDVISNCKFPISMREEISSLLEELRFELVAVRSSANNEDGASKSFAGQYNTYLNVEPNDVFDKIVDCWSSVLDDNVVSYIGDDEFNIYSVNVVVQRMSNPDYAGVAFSLNPTSRSKNYSLIESCQGLGEKLVSGETTPTKYIVHRELKVADMIFGDKMLTDDNIRELESYILEIEKEYGFPVDTEWCVTDNHIYILQARPITAFSDEVIVYDKIISREKKLFELEIYYNGEYNGIKALTKAYYNNPLFHFENTNITNI